MIINHYHYWKTNAYPLIHFDDEQHSQTNDLNECKQVNFNSAHMTQENVVGLMFLRH